MRCLVSLLLVIMFIPACGQEITGPAVTDDEVEVFNEFLQIINNGADLQWGGTVINRSLFTTNVAVQLKAINPDSVVFYITSENLVQVEPQSQASFTIIEEGTQIPTPIISSIIGWEVTSRLVSFK